MENFKFIAAFYWFNFSICTYI